MLKLRCKPEPLRTSVSRISNIISVALNSTVKGASSKEQMTHCPTKLPGMVTLGSDVLVAGFQLNEIRSGILTCPASDFTGELMMMIGSLLTKEPPHTKVQVRSTDWTIFWVKR